MCFLLTNTGRFSSSTAFSWSNWEQYLLELIILVFQKELKIEDALPIPPYTQHHLLWLKTSLWCGWWWFIRLPHGLFHSTLLYSIHFSLPVTICFKNVAFSLCLSRESHAEIWSRRFFSLNLCGTQTSKRLT